MDVKNTKRFQAALTGLAMAGLLTLLTVMPARAQDAGSAATDKRVTVVRQTVRGGRDGARSDSQRLEYAPLTAGSQRQSSGSSMTKGANASEKAGNNDFWFYDADVLLFNDIDNDGYFHGIDLLFDVDTVFDEVDVYAVVFLSLEGGEWNEYAVTDAFWLYGATSDDEYVIVTELQSGYPTGSYDLLIELYDAVDGTFLASFGPEDTSELSYLPLEDYQKDTRYIEEIIVVGHGGGNAFGLLLLALFVPLMRRLARVAHVRYA